MLRNITDSIGEEVSRGFLVRLTTIGQENKLAAYFLCLLGRNKGQTFRGDK